MDEIDVNKINDKLRGLRGVRNPIAEEEFVNILSKENFKIIHISGQWDSCGDLALKKVGDKIYYAAFWRNDRTFDNVVYYVTEFTPSKFREYNARSIFEWVIGELMRKEEEYKRRIKPNEFINWLIDGEPINDHKCELSVTWYKMTSEDGKYVVYLNYCAYDHCGKLLAVRVKPNT